MYIQYKNIGTYVDTVFVFNVITFITYVYAIYIHIQYNYTDKLHLFNMITLTTYVYTI